MTEQFAAQHRQEALDGETANQETPEPTATATSKSPGLGVTGKFPAAAMEEQREYGAPGQIGGEA